MSTSHPIHFLSRREALSMMLLGAASCAVADDDNSRVLRFTIKDEFGKGSTKDVEALLKSAAAAIWDHCPQTKFIGPSFFIYRDLRYPITHFKRDEAGRIVIGLNTVDNYWAQYVFQFAHEFCHALIDHSNASQERWHELRHANQWLEECLCETASLFTLRALSKSWPTKAPYPNWKSYSPKLSSYAEDRLAQPTHRLPAGESFPEWFRTQQPSLRKQWAQREKNTIIAAQILPLFEAEPTGWEATTMLKLGTRDVEKPLAQHLIEWKTNAREDLRPFVTRLAAVFEVAL